MDEKFILEEIYDNLRNINSDGKGLILEGLVRGMLLGMSLAEKKLPAMPNQPPMPSQPMEPPSMPEQPASMDTTDLETQAPPENPLRQPHFPTGETGYGP
ncbi:MAG: hypothetical protein IK038_03230 [Bacteroidaceae bacterium]|nr:hypothetical protein [Bacteroidaceae bacterium]